MSLIARRRPCSVRLIATALLGSLALAPAAVAQNDGSATNPQAWQAVVTVDAAPVRVNASRGHYVMANLPRGAVVTASDEKEGFIRVAASGPAFADTYGHIKFPTEGTPQVAVKGARGTALQTVRVYAPDLRYDQHPDHSWKAVATLRKGDTFEIVDVKRLANEIAYVVRMPAGVTGWVDQTDLRRATPGDIQAWRRTVEARGREADVVARRAADAVEAAAQPATAVPDGADVEIGGPRPIAGASPEPAIGEPQPEGTDLDASPPDVVATDDAADAASDPTSAAADATSAATDPTEAKAIPTRAAGDPASAAAAPASAATDPASAADVPARAPQRAPEATPAEVDYRFITPAEPRPERRVTIPNARPAPAAATPDRPAADPVRAPVRTPEAAPDASDVTITQPDIAPAAATPPAAPPTEPANQPLAIEQREIAPPAAELDPNRLEARRMLARLSGDVAGDLTREQSRNLYRQLEEVNALLRTGNLATAEVQPLRALYDRLSILSTEDPVVQRYAKTRARQLGLWAEAQTKVSQLATLEMEMRQTNTTMLASIRRMRSSGIYDAVGRLSASSVFVGDMLPRFYRVHDPATGRTIAYIDAEQGASLGRHLGQIVGIRGERVRDPGLGLTLIRPAHVDTLTPSNE